MKKFFLSLAVAFVGTTGGFAQSSMLATLTHDGQVSTFYGATALKQAHEAAVSGDVVTLSSGTFVATDITKALTIRGAGMGIDTLSQTEPTVISGDFKINIPEATDEAQSGTVAHRLTLEGIYHNQTIRYEGTLKNAMFLKCRLKTVTSGSGNIRKLKDASFIHCRIADRLYLDTDCSASCVNCAIQFPWSYSSRTSNFELMNCVINSGALDDVHSSSFKNCVLISGSRTYGYINSENTAYNCVYYGAYSDPFKNITNSTNKKVDDIKELFKTYAGQDLGNLDSETFELTDAAKTKYLGMDGTTQVGIHGGNLPFDPVPSNPQITKCNVAAKSTADGKLSVDIQINSEK